MNVMEARRRTLGGGIYEKTVIGETVLANGSLARRYPGLHLYGKSTQESTTGAQLLDADQYYAQYKQDDGTYAISADEMGNIRIPITTNMVGKQYTFSASGIPAANDTFYAQYFKSSDEVYNGNVIGGSTSTFFQSKITFTPEETGGYIRFSHSNSNDGIVQIKDIMLNLGAAVLPWEPYTGGAPSPSLEYPQEIVSKAEDGQVTVTITGDDVGTQTLTVSTPNGLPGIPVTAGGNYTDETGQKWVCDEVDFKRGVYIQRVKKATGITWNIHNGYAVEGSELFSTNDITDGREGGNILANIAICSKLKYDARILTFNINGFYEGYGRVFARIKGASDVEEFNQLMSGAEILYQLETPVETPLTPEELAAYAAMHTNYPTTTVMNDEGVYMALDYKTKKSLEVN